MAPSSDLTLIHTNYLCYPLVVQINALDTPYQFMVYYSHKRATQFDRSLGESGDIFINFAIPEIWYRSETQWCLIPKDRETNNEIPVTHPNFPQAKLVASRKYSITWAGVESRPKISLSSGFEISLRTANSLAGTVKHLGVVDLTHLP